METEEIGNKKIEVRRGVEEKERERIKQAKNLNSRETK